MIADARRAGARPARLRSGRGRVRPERDVAAATSLAVARTDVGTRRRGHPDSPGPRRERPALDPRGRGRRRDRPMGRCAPGRRHARPRRPRAGDRPTDQARRVHPRLQRRRHDTAGGRRRRAGQASGRARRPRRCAPRAAPLDRPARGLGADLVATSPYKYFGPHQGMAAVAPSCSRRSRPTSSVRRPTRTPIAGKRAHRATRRWRAPSRRSTTSPRWAAVGPARAVRRRLRRLRGARTRARATVPRRDRGTSRRSAVSASPTPGASTSERRPSRSASATNTRSTRPRQLGRSRHLHLGGSLLRDRGVRTARLARDRWRRARSAFATITRSRRSIGCWKRWPTWLE